MDQNRAVGGVNMGHLWQEVDMLNGEMRDLLELYRSGKIKPTIDSVYKFADIAAAHRRMHERKNIGKIVLVP
jgi:NADPH:quinone reductase-like Zn-dependent oxidoreductase